MKLTFWIMLFCSINPRLEAGTGVVRSPGLRGIAEEEAAAKVARFMVVAAWRRRRDDLRCLRKTLEFQVCSTTIVILYLRHAVSPTVSINQNDHQGRPGLKLTPLKFI